MKYIYEYRRLPFCDPQDVCKALMEYENMGYEIFKLELQPNGTEYLMYIRKPSVIKEDLIKKEANMKIEELIYTSNMDQWGNCYGKNPPSTRQIVNKINEIIGWINSQEEGGEDEQD